MKRNAAANFGVLSGFGVKSLRKRNFTNSNIWDRIIAMFLTFFGLKYIFRILLFSSPNNQKKQKPKMKFKRRQRLFQTRSEKRREALFRHVERLDQPIAND